MLSFSSSINCAILFLVGFHFHPLSLGGSYAIVPHTSKHSKLELSKIKGVLLNSDNNISALPSGSEQVEDEDKLLEFY